MALTAAVAASPSTGAAPLAVFFDGSESTSDSVTFSWNFGDGAISTAESPIHTYTVAGTYVAQLTVTSASGAMSSSSVTIVVTGSGEGPVTSNMNFRWAPTVGRLSYTGTGHDRFVMNAVFNTVDLPPRLEGVAASFSINNSFTLNGILNAGGVFENPNNSTLKFQISLIAKNQNLQVFIGGADLSTALTGKLGGTLANGRYPITCSADHRGRTELLDHGNIPVHQWAGCVQPGAATGTGQRRFLRHFVRRGAGICARNWAFLPIH